jgi:hypothetical protein
MAYYAAIKMDSPEDILPAASVDAAKDEAAASRASVT